MRLRQTFVLLLLVFLFTTVTFAGDAQWVEVRSPNFSVITDAGEKRGREVAFHFEQMRSVFGTLMAHASVSFPVPLQIVAFRNTKEMRQMAPLFNGKPTEVAGLFQGGEDRSFIMLDMSVDNPWSVVFHEYAHRLMDGNLTVRTDPWFEEGFAEYFSSIEVDNKEVRVGKIPNETYQILQQTGLMKVFDLFRVQHNSKVYNESGDHRTIFYAESGLVVHYLYDNQLMPKLTVYYDTLQLKNKSIEESFQAAFGMTTDQFDKTLRRYLNDGRYRYHPIPTPSGIVAAQFTTTPVSPADARATLADIHAHSPDYRQKAVEEFQEVLKMDPDNALALRGLGFAYLQQRDFEHAAEYLHRAVQRNSQDAHVHYYYAMLLNQQGGRDERSEEIKKELETTIALDPKLADAYSLLGWTQAATGEPEKGMATLKKAVELAPRNDTYLFNLANAYMMNRKMDEAIAMFRGLTASSNPEVAARSSQALAQAIQFKERSNTFAVRIGDGAAHATTPATQQLVESQENQDTQKAAIPVPPPASVHFVKGKLVSVDCSATPQALLTVAAGSKSIKLQIRDRGHVLLLGADTFSCDWKGKNVAVNYRDRADGDGDVVSLELQ